MSGRNATGEGSVYQRKDGRWVAAAYVPIADGTYKRVSHYVRTKAEAKAKLREMTDRAAKNMPAPPPSLTVEAYLAEWLVHIKQHVRRSTWVAYEANTRLHIVPRIGRKKLAQLSVRDVRLMIDGLRKDGKGKRTVQYVHATLRGALEHAYREELVTRNVAKMVRVERPAANPKEPLSVAEARKLLTATRDDEDQALWVVMLLLGLAGTGKTTTMAGVRAMWEAQHGPGAVVGLAPSAMAAQVLAADLGIVTDNTAQWIAQQDQQTRREHRIRLLTEAITTGDHPARIQGLRAALDRVQAEYDRWRLQPGQLLIVDEAGMTGTFTLARLAGQAADAGAKLLLVGDPGQLSAVETGGAFGLLTGRHPDPPTLTQVRRFVDPDGTRRVWEEQSADRLRAGDPTALADYADHGRIHSGEQEQMIDAAFTAWSTDVRAGRSSVLIAADNDTVTELNRRAQADLVDAGLVEDTATVAVRNGLSVGVGDVVVTRRIDRTQADGTTGTAGGGRLGDGFVRNGQRWQVLRAHRDGSLTVRLLDGDRPGTVPVTLTAGYVREHVDLGYATTAHRAQGITVDTSHVLADALTQREPFYVAMTRGRHANHAYLVLDPATTLRDRLVHPVGGPADQDSYTTAQVADAITGHCGAATSAHETIQAEQERAVSIRQLADEADAIAGYAHDLAASELLLIVLGDTPAVHRMLDDEHFPDLVLAIRHAHSKGVDLHRQLPVIIGTRRPETLTAQTLTTVIHTHLRTHPGARGPVLVAGIVADATAGLSDPELVDAIRKQLAADAINSGEPWTRAISESIPDDRRYAAVRILAAYRERWDISGPEPLGRRPDQSANSSHHADHRRLTDMLRRLPVHTHRPAPADIEQSTRTPGRTL